jgi:hypothetical protein
MDGAAPCHCGSAVDDEDWEVACGDKSAPPAQRACHNHPGRAQKPSERLQDRDRQPNGRHSDTANGGTIVVRVPALWQIVIGIVVIAVLAICILLFWNLFSRVTALERQQRRQAEAPLLCHMAPPTAYPSMRRASYSGGRRLRGPRRQRDSTGQGSSSSEHSNCGGTSFVLIREDHHGGGSGDGCATSHDRECHAEAKRRPRRSREAPEWQTLSSNQYADTETSSISDRAHQRRSRQPMVLIVEPQTPTPADQTADAVAVGNNGAARNSASGARTRAQAGRARLIRAEPALLINQRGTPLKKAHS